ncbi:hypothetical protein [Haloactinopolyspora alba]|uniref:hypothetical protein n=1 Tax=Haloactinopolyspora alba TaxID=648780 RepID=UPI00101B90AC|nr:hypothetical protein [Haloactinopolyspora alba]
MTRVEFEDAGAGRVAASVEDDALRLEDRGDGHHVYIAAEDVPELIAWLTDTFPKPELEREPQIGDTIEVLTDGPSHPEPDMPRRIGYHAFRKGALATLTSTSSEPDACVEARGVHHRDGYLLTQTLGRGDFKLV